MSEREDAILERLLQRLENPELEDPGLDLSEQEKGVWREYSELVGLLPQALEPVEPSEGTREAILGAVRAQPAAGTGAAFVAAPQAVSTHSVGSLQLVAAVLGALALGLAVFAGWTVRGSQMQEARLAEIGSALERSLEREESLAAAQTRIHNFQRVVTAAGMRVCPLRPRGERPSQPVARGAVYMDVKEANWFLTARDLAPCPRGSQYKVWFVVGDGEKVAGATLRVESDTPVIFGSGEIPEGVRAVLLTLEEDPSVEAPTGEPVLYGDESLEML